MSVELLISIVGVCFTVLAFFVGRLTAAKNTGQEYGVMLTEIGYIKSGVDDMKKKMEQNDQRYVELSERVTALENIVKIYHNGGAA